jgi:hypothetical protein
MKKSIINDGCHEKLLQFIRPHMALKGKTPAEMTGINLQLGQNTWESLIRKAKSSHFIHDFNCSYIEEGSRTLKF